MKIKISDGNGGKSKSLKVGVWGPPVVKSIKVKLTMKVDVDDKVGLKV